MTIAHDIILLALHIKQRSYNNRFASYYERLTRYIILISWHYIMMQPHYIFINAHSEIIGRHHIKTYGHNILFSWIHIRMHPHNIFMSAPCIKKEWQNNVIRQSRLSILFLLLWWQTICNVVHEVFLVSSMCDFTKQPCHYVWVTRFLVCVT
jgi:hypothetical protein